MKKAVEFVNKQEMCTEDPLELVESFTIRQTSFLAFRLRLRDISRTEFTLLLAEFATVYSALTLWRPHRSLWKKHRLYKKTPYSGDFPAKSPFFYFESGFTALALQGVGKRYIGFGGSS